MVILISVIYPSVISAQNDTLQQETDSVPGRAYLLQKVERNGEILPEIPIKEVTVYAHPKFERKSDLRKYERLIYNLKKVYPYAIIVRTKLANVDHEIQGISDEKQRKAYLKSVEKDVFATYEGDIRDMTISQGRLLIKLIDRETQNTSYTLIKEYRGKFAAAFWQGIARIFGTNLKEEYDPFGDDALIESIIQDIDAGLL